jgi:hypothetical protein
MGCARFDDVNAEALIGTLAEVLRELAGAADNCELGWLRPLAVLTAPSEFSSLRKSRVLRPGSQTNAASHAPVTRPSIERAGRAV